jgi:Zn-dependent M16 (insulinase) family peptidase
MPNWIYGGNIENIFSSLYERETLEKLKTKIYEKYFDYCMEKYLIINKHAAFISLIPDVEKNIDVKISERDIDNLSMMKKFIDAPETNFDVIDVADINKELINYDKVTEYKNILHINIESDEIIYVDFIFNTDSVPKGFLYELGVLSEILVFVSLENIQQNNTNKNMRALLDCIGKVKTEFTVENIQNCNQHVMYMKLRTRFLRDDAQNIIDLINNISSIKKFGDKNLIKKLLMQKMINMNNTYLSDLEEIIKIKALSYHIREFKCQEMVSGIDFYLFLRDLVSDFDDRFRSLIKNLYIIHDRIFTQDNLTIQIACNNENLNFMHATLDHFTDSLKHKNKKHVNYDFNNQIINEGFFTSANVNSNTMVIPLNNNNAKSGVEYVLENLITRDYLTQSIRLNGGAYDTGCDFIDGVIYFYSSADPNIKTTFESFLSAPDYIINKNFSERDLKKAIIGAINNFDKIKSIENRIAISFTRYINNITYDDIHKIHKEMREVNIDQLKYLASVIKNNLEKSTILTVGKRSEILNNKDIYDKIYKLI